jgi:hypothetical protein
VRTILAIIRTDWVLISRNKIGLYMMFSPVLLALAYMAVVGGVNQGALTFAVPAQLDAAQVAQLQRVARVEQLADEQAVLRRVGRMDSVAGVLPGAGGFTLVLEGNEPQGFAAQAQLLLQRALAGGIPPFQSLHIPSSGGHLAEFIAASLFLLVIFMAGTVPGFNIVAERESRSLQALAVTPLTLGRYLLARIVSALILAAVNTAVVGLAIRRADMLLHLLLSVLAAALLLGLLAAAFGYTADNQITAIASLKLMMPLVLIVPLSSMFLSEQLQWLFYWLPQYWYLAALRQAWAGAAAPFALLALLVTSLLWALLLGRPIARRFGLR